jgi:hypothetical protein
MRIAATVCSVFLLQVAAPATAQSLFLDRGQSAVEAVAGWSIGPSSDGLETRVGVAIDGRLDLGVGFNRYTTDFDDFSSTFTEVAPYGRVFLVRERDGAPPG